jgi:hypothetical protein
MEIRSIDGLRVGLSGKIEILGSRILRILADYYDLSRAIVERWSSLRWDWWESDGGRFLVNERERNEV